MVQAKRSIEDILSLLDPNSIIRSAFRDEINLAEQTALLEFNPDQTYITLELTIRKNQDTLDYQEKIAEICKSARPMGKHERFYAGVNEAVRNAYQHGNKKDPAKKVTVSYKITEDTFEVVASDEGGKLNASFIPFILLHRYRELNQPLSYYQFSGTKQSYENSGIGTFVIHMVSDEVNYFRNSNGGLSIQMIIKKDKNQPKY